MDNKQNKYVPQIIIKSNIGKYKIKNVNNKYEVIKKVSKYLERLYLSTKEQTKPIINIWTDMKIEIWKSGIKETFGNDKYYLNLSTKMKKTKIATMSVLAKLIKYANVRCNEANNYHNANSKVKFAYLITKIIIDGISYDVTIDIKKSPDGKNKFYIHNLSIKNK